MTPQETKEFGKKLKEKRESLDMTLEQAARYVGCEPESLFNVEAGVLEPLAGLKESMKVFLGLPLQHASFNNTDGKLIERQNWIGIGHKGKITYVRKKDIRAMEIQPEKGKAFIITDSWNVEGTLSKADMQKLLKLVD
jgi:transcriptional regulator with XRE-family HTH domain